MDILCPNCGEPWDHDELHDNDKGLPYDEASRLFRTKGCGAVFDVECEKQEGTNADLAGELYAMLGDDLDGAASMLEDYGLT